MEYIVGSLSDVISGSNTHNSKNSAITQGSAVVIEYKNENITTYKKRKNRNNDETFDTKKKETTLHMTNVHEPPLKKEHNAEKRIRFKQKQEKRENLFNEEKESRTVIVKNLPNKLKKSKLKRVFENFGEIESVRLRCAPLSDPRVPKKVAVITGNFHPDRTNISAFVCFTSLESANKALAANGALVADHHILVDKALQTYEYDQRKAIFIGNCPFGAEEEDLWKMFESCGKIVDIRIIRDRKTSIGKGFAYVNFESADAVELALHLDGKKLKDRELRVSRINRKASTSQKKSGQRSSNFPTKFRNSVTGNEKQNKKPMKRKHELDSKKKGKKQKRADERERIKMSENYQQPIIKVNKIKSKEFNEKNHVDGLTKKIPLFQGSTFQGQKNSNKDKLKKKKKINKGELKKKIMIKQLAFKAEPHSKKIKMKPTIT